MDAVRAASRPAARTVKPSRASRRATAAPMPELAPVTRAAFICGAPAPLLAVVAGEIRDDRRGLLGREWRAVDGHHLPDRLFPASLVLDRRVHDDVIEAVAHGARGLNLCATWIVREDDVRFVRGSRQGADR